MVKLKIRTDIKSKVRFIGLGFIVLFCIVGARAYFLQIMRCEALTRRIESQHECSIDLSPCRGTIYDRNGVELAVSISIDSLYARPRLLDDAGIARMADVAAILEMPVQKLRHLASSKKQFVWLKRHVPPDQADRIRQLGLTGLEFVKESKRYYPNKDLAGQVIGFAGIDNQGLEGLEYEHNRLLQGTPRKLIAKRDALGRHLIIEGFNSSTSTQGNDCTLTIDRTIQHIVEKELQAAVSLSGARGGTAVVMDPWTGEVLAMANVPLFNLNKFSRYDAGVRRNRALTDVYEPGSTFKPFLVAAALEEGVIKPRDIFFCENGSFRVADRTIHDVHPHGWLSVTKILQYSSNIGVSKISRQLGTEAFYRYIRKFGFAAQTGIAFPIEATGFVPLPYRCSEHTQSTMAFGQGLSVTPLQLVSAYAALANGGLLMRPLILKQATDSSGAVVTQNTPSVRARILSDATTRIIQTMLQRVTSADGTGAKAAIAGYTVAGKTGTSQKHDPSQNGYSRKKIVASFGGYAPATHPRIAVLVIVDEPQRMAYGGEIAAPAFSTMARQILNYLQVPPDSDAGIEGPPGGWRTTQTPAVRRKTVDEA